MICMLPNIQTVYAKQSSSQEEARVKFSSVLFKDSLGDPLTLKRHVPGNWIETAVCAYLKVAFDVSERFS